MKKVQRLHVKDTFNPLDMEFRFYDHDMLKVNGESFYTANERYLKKMFSSIDYSYRFVKDFFTVSPRDAQKFFSSVPDFDLSRIFVNKKYSFIYLSSPIVYENYKKIFTEFLRSARLTSDDVYVYSEDSDVSNDQYLFVYDDKAIAFVVSLVTETVTFYQCEIQDNMIFLFKDYSLSLADSEFSDSIAVLGFEKADVRSLYKDFLDTNLTASELVEALKVLRVVRGYKNLQVINDNFFLENIGDDFLLNLRSLNKAESLTNKSFFTVSSFLANAKELLLQNDEVNIVEVYKFYEKILKGKLLYIN